ncbi:MAG: hypothetical protein AAF434_20390 [Pseudomonadota bacterium]
MFKKATAALLIYCLAQSAGATILRDPMRPKIPVVQQLPKNEDAKPVQPGIQKPSLELHAISYQRASTRHSAIINGQWVTQGAVVDGATVVEIGEETVQLQHNDKDITLTLTPPIKRKKTEG